MGVKSVAGVLLAERWLDGTWELGGKKIKFLYLYNIL